MAIHQDVDLYAGLFNEGESARLDLDSGRGAWVQVTRGELDLNGERLSAGDGASIKDIDTIEIEGRRDAEVFAFDMTA